MPSALRSIRGIPLLILILLRAGGAGGGLVINEVLYDPPGPDSGGEFVELFNSGPGAVRLRDVKLEFANGADGPSWHTRWTCGTDAELAAGAFLLIGDRGWEGPPAADAVCSLGLQNGPDALRLVRGAEVLDLLGYGGELEPSLREGNAHPGAESGCSLARRPDGGDTGDNLADWRSRTPTPGAANFAELSAAVAAMECEPPSLPSAGGRTTLNIRIANDGLSELPAGVVRLVERGCGIDLAEGWLDALAPEAACWIRLEWRPASPGRFALGLRLPADGARQPPVLDLGYYQVGPSALHISEVMAAPVSGACEWVELANAGPGGIDLGECALEEQDGASTALPGLRLGEGDRLLLVQDEDRHRRWLRELEDAGAPGIEQLLAVDALEPDGSWPSLNNAPPPSREFADRLCLRDSGGVVIDHLTLGGSGSPVPVGRSLERESWAPLGDPAANWGPCTAEAGGTPGLVNSRTALIGAGETLELRPNPFRPQGDGGALRVLFRIGGGEKAWDVAVYDLWGRRVRDLGGDDLGPGARSVAWDGADDSGIRCGTGAYIVLLRRYDAAGRLTQREKALAVLGPPTEP